MVDEAVFLRGRSGHVEITLCILLDIIQRSTGMVYEYVIQFFTQTQDLFRLDGDIRCLTLRAAQGLVQVDRCVGEGIAFPFRACC